MYTTLIALLLVVATTLAVQFDGPNPTPAVDPLAHVLDGWTPRPTAPPLQRRQSDPGVCGYLEGDAEFSVSCTVGTCAYAASQSWFGCCTGSSVTDCALFTTCVGFSSLSSCISNSNCASDALAMGCTDSAYPYCQTMLSQVLEGTMAHYVCGKSSGLVIEVLSTITGSMLGSVTSTSSLVASRSWSSARSASDSASGSGSADETSSEAETEREKETATIGGLASSQSARTSERISSLTTAEPASSTAGAVRTAQAVAGAVGGAMLAWML